MYFRVTPGGHASVPITHKDGKTQLNNQSNNKISIFCGRSPFRIVTYNVVYMGKCNKPVFCILQVFVNGVSGGTDSPSPIVTSSTKDMDGVLAMGLSKS